MKKSASTTLVAITTVATALLLAAGVIVVVFRASPTGPPHPKDWDPRVLDIVRFDEAHRGLTFKQPVFVDFLDAKAYSDRVRTDQSQLTDKEKQQLSASEGELRAFGLSNSTANLLDVTNELLDTGTLAFYDPRTERVIVRGTEMTVDLRVTLIHEFTHVLQDQHFGIGPRRTNSFSTSQEGSSFRTVFEGDAVRVENEYIDSLSADDKRQYDDVHNKEVADAKSGLADVPVALQAIQSAPYLLGPPFTQLLEADGNQAELDRAFKEPPVTDEQVIDPRAFSDHQPALDVQEPARPDGVNGDAVVDRGDFGELSWYLVLAERIDPIVALQAADGWGGDAYVAYQQDAKTCVRLDWKGDTPSDQREMRDALDQWVAAMPTGAASVNLDGDLLHVQTCDPGAANLTLNNRALDAVQIPATRSQFMLQAVQTGGLPMDKAFGFGDCVVRAIGFDNFVAADKAGDLTPELQALVTSAVQDCQRKAGG